MPAHKGNHGVNMKLKYQPPCGRFFYFQIRPPPEYSGQNLGLDWVDLRQLASQDNRMLLNRQLKPLLPILQRGFFFGEKIMKKNKGYVKAKIKSQGQIAQVYPPAVYWGKPLDDVHWCHGADEIVMPYLGKIVWVKKIRRGILDFYYEIKDTNGITIMPNWIDYFESEHLVPPAGWEDIVDDIRLMEEEERIFFVEDLPIFTG